MQLFANNHVLYNKNTKYKKMKSLVYSDVKEKSFPTIKTGNGTLDSFLSTEGGFVIGSAIFLTGTAGAGKTTFSIVIQNLLKDYKTIIYSREVTSSRMKYLMRRYNIVNRNAYIADKNACPTLNDFIEDLNEIKPKVVIVDSLQVIMKEDYRGVSADVAGYSIIESLREWSTNNDAILIVVGHVTKDGEFEGRNTIKHMFDSHLEMIFDKKSGIRTISWAKNRDGVIATLYYEFGKDSLVFTQSLPQQLKDLDVYISEAIKSFIGCLNKEDKNYKFFKEDLKREIVKIQCSSDELYEANAKCIKIIRELLKKYEF